MYQSDYILRLVAQLGAALRRAMQRVAEEPDAALEDADEGVRFAAELDPSLVDSLAPGGVVMLLSAGGTFDVVRAVGLAVALRVRAQVFEARGHGSAAAHQLSVSHALMNAAFEAEPARSTELLDALESELNDTEDPGDRDV